MLLDYPYIYPLAEEKLFCTHINPHTNIRCTGMIDYDDGFNHLLCRKCGTRYLAVDLEDKKATNDIIIRRGGRTPMKVIVTKGDIKYEPIMSSSVMERRSPKSTNNNTKMKVVVTGGNVNHKIEETTPEPIKEKIETGETTVHAADSIVSSATDNIELTSQTEYSSDIPSIPTTEEINESVEVKEEVKKETPKRRKKATTSEVENIDQKPTVEVTAEVENEMVSQIEESGSSKYPASKKSKKSGGAKKASGAKFIPSPGVKMEHELLED